MVDNSYFNDNPLARNVNSHMINNTEFIANNRTYIIIMLKFKNAALIGFAFLKLRFEIIFDALLYYYYII